MFCILAGLLPNSSAISAQQTGHEGVSVQSSSIPTNAVWIRTAQDLASITEGTQGHYVLENNISLSGAWSPLNDFRGTFDGQGHTISNLNVSGIEMLGCLPAHQMPQ